MAPSAAEYRRKAIQLLGKTFSEANAVLVLDRELEIVDSFTTTFVEIGLRILCSGWLKRLWTLQEATLASEAHGEEKLYFQMRDGPFLYQKYDRDRQSTWTTDNKTSEVQSEERHLLFDFGVMVELGAQIPSVRAMRVMRKGWSPFRVIYSAVEYRSTSKAEDVPVCVASLLGLDVSTILSAETTEQRMVNFYLLMREVPSGVLWCHQAQKLSTPPFRWALSSITDCPATTYWDWANGICDVDGLHVRYSGFVFAQDEGKETPDGMPEDVLPRFCTIAAPETGDELQLCWPTPTSPVIPMHRNLALLFRPTERNGKPPNVVVVVIEGTYGCEGDVETEFVCKIVGYVNVYPRRHTQEPVFRGSMTSPNQRWRVT